MDSTSTNYEVSSSGNSRSQYCRNHEYSQKLAPSSYPDVHFSCSDQVVAEPIRSDSHGYAEGDFVSPGFFQNIDLGLFTLPQGEMEWAYSRRREAQRILPFLYLGPWSCLSKQNWLQDEGITLLLGVRDQRYAQSRLFSGQKAADTVGIASETFDISDNQELIARLPQVIRRINDHIYPPVISASGTPTTKKVFVFCETGNGLSALVVVAYVMVMLNLELGPALTFLHSQRFCIDMEDGYKQLLASFEGILNAKRDVANARRASTNSNLAAPAMTLSKKRSFADRVEDEDMQDGMTFEASALDRKPMAPFNDRWG
ncbi:hypothetical protein BJX99DRAFT_220561 [Aspergillus californicus]